MWEMVSECWLRPFCSPCGCAVCENLAVSNALWARNRVSTKAGLRCKGAGCCVFTCLSHLVTCEV